MKSKRTARTVAEINRLAEDLWIALGPKRARTRTEAERTLARMRRTAEAVKIRKIVDPLAAGLAGAEPASATSSTRTDKASPISF